MKWTESIRNLIYKNRSRMKCGATCRFIPISTELGVKLYLNRKIRNRSLKAQQRAARHKLGPKVGDCFEMLIFISERGYAGGRNERVAKMHGYLTQRMQIPRSDKNIDFDLQILKLKLRKIGIHHNDLHNENVGYFNGTLMAVDFDSGSCRLSKV